MAFDRQEAWVYLTKDTYDPVILDTMLPYKNDFEILIHLRQAVSDVPILCLTAMD
ncbi:hypothetical protein CL176_06200 [Suicoccus acidiformans]|uniref:Response regulatory domain-containing protein n=1 Tax=Suicoccus acidiformans TaxID=2036206 RepID=A0A347WKL2_9LACT|nr:hypothetical protein CL176_06200 [Suicoccus acidiformans]